MVTHHTTGQRAQHHATIVGRTTADTLRISHPFVAALVARYGDIFILRLGTTYAGVVIKNIGLHSKSANSASKSDSKTFHGMPLWVGMGVSCCWMGERWLNGCEKTANSRHRTADLWLMSGKT